MSLPHTCECYICHREMGDSLAAAQKESMLKIGKVTATPEPKELKIAESEAPEECKLKAHSSMRCRNLGEAKLQIEGPVRRWAMQDFSDGRVVIDFRDWTHNELEALLAVCSHVNPDRPVPAYRFGPVYFCEGGRWYEGGTHNMVGKHACRATDIFLK